VGVAVILTFLILYGLVAGDLSDVPKWMKVTFGTLAGLFTLIVVLHISGLSDIVLKWFSFSENGEVWMSILMIALVLGVMGFAIWGGKSKTSQ